MPPRRSRKRSSSGTFPDPKRQQLNPTGFITGNCGRIDLAHIGSHLASENPVPEHHSTTEHDETVSRGRVYARATATRSTRPSIPRLAIPTTPMSLGAPPEPLSAGTTASSGTASEPLSASTNTTTSPVETMAKLDPRTFTATPFIAALDSTSSLRGGSQARVLSPAAPLAGAIPPAEHAEKTAAAPTAELPSPGSVTSSSHRACGGGAWWPDESRIGERLSGWPDLPDDGGDVGSLMFGGVYLGEKYASSAACRKWVAQQVGDAHEIVF